MTLQASPTIREPVGIRMVFVYFDMNFSVDYKLEPKIARLTADTHHNISSSIEEDNLAVGILYARGHELVPTE